MDIEKYRQTYAEVFNNLKKFNLNCCCAYKDKIKYADEIFPHLQKKAFDTFHSIQILTEISKLQDAHCLYRILLENVVNFIFLSHNEDKIHDYKSSKLKITKALLKKISNDTKYMSEPENLTNVLDKIFINDFKDAIQIVKEENKIYKQDKWTNISFFDKAKEIGLYSRYVEYKKESDIIHSNWFSKDFDNALNIHYSLVSVIDSSMAIMKQLITYINDENNNILKSNINKLNIYYNLINELFNKIESSIGKDI